MSVNQERTRLLAKSADRDNFGDSGEVHSDVDEKSAYNPNGATRRATIFNFIKASIGAGSFALPWAIAQAGIVAGSIGLLFFGVVSLYTMRLMLDCKKMALDNGFKPKGSQFVYTDVGRSVGWWGVLLVNFNVVMCNLGACAGYLIFIGVNIQSSMKTIFHADLSEMETYAIVLPAVLLLTYLPSYKMLAYGAYAGMLLLVAAVVAIVVYGFQHAHEFVGLTHYDLARVDTFPLFFGVAAFLLCTHGMVIPMEQSLARPAEMPAVITIGGALVLASNIPFSIFAYLLFGTTVNGYVFCSLPTGTLLEVIRLSLALELSLTFPIVFYPATQTVEEYLLPILGPTWVEVKRRVIRTLLVLTAWGLALSVPVFQLCLSLVGGLAACALAFILPPLFHLYLSWKCKMTRPTRQTVGHVAIFALGVIGLIITTYTNITAIVDSYHKNSTNTTCGTDS